MGFAAKEVIVAPKALPDDDLSKLASLKGTIATAMGKALLESYKWSRPVAMNFKKYDKLDESKKLKGKTQLKWQLRADDKAKHVLFIVSSGSKELDEVEIFDLSDVAEGASVMNLQGADTTMKNASSKQANKFNDDPTDKGTYNDPRPNKKQVQEKAISLKGINTKQRIVLCGHGSGPDVSGDEIFHAKTFGGRSADEIVKFLIDQGLSTSYEGTIYLSGCHTAAGFTDPRSFASKVHSGLTAKGYKSLSVAGTPGVAWTNAKGDKGAVPAVIGKELQHTRDRSAELVEKLEKALEGAADELQIAEDQDKLFELQYKNMDELIEEMPPEARDSLKQKLLKPIQDSRDELAPALQQMRQSKRTLEGAIKTEKEYLDKLDKLLAQKSKLDSGQISKDDYWREQTKVFSVEEWWGHFGPAKATRVKVGKNESKFKQLTEALRLKVKKK